MSKETKQLTSLSLELTGKHSKEDIRKLFEVNGIKVEEISDYYSREYTVSTDAPKEIIKTLWVISGFMNQST
jgi:hypothetical protein